MNVQMRIHKKNIALEIAAKFASVKKVTLASKFLFSYFLKMLLKLYIVTCFEDFCSHAQFLRYFILFVTM
jgi:hypothetical protein